MITLSPETSQSPHALLKIRGRMISSAEFPHRLKNLSASLGIGSANIRTSTWPAAGGAAEQVRCGAGENAVYVLSTKVRYNPNWGGFSGLPRLLDKSKTKNSLTTTPADFIAPFLNLYREAQENIFISQTTQGQCLITLPENMPVGEGSGSKYRFNLHLERIVQPDSAGDPQPILMSGNQHSFVVSADFQQTVAGLLNEWMRGRKLAIGNYLESRLFSFEASGSDIDGDNPYTETILPYLAEIVTHPTPNLRAAEIHLQQIFMRNMKRLTSEGGTSSRNLLCIAGLDIDMTAFTGEEEHYFVPWQAYVTLGGKESGKEYFLAQDDLFMQLMQ